MSYLRKSVRTAPAKWVYPHAGVEVLSLIEDKHLDVVATYRKNGKPGRQTARADEYGRYLWFNNQKVYLDELRRVGAWST